MNDKKHWINKDGRVFNYKCKSIFFLLLPIPDGMRQEIKINYTLFPFPLFFPSLSTAIWTRKEVTKTLKSTTGTFLFCLQFFFRIIQLKMSKILTILNKKVTHPATSRPAKTVQEPFFRLKSCRIKERREETKQKIDWFRDFEFMFHNEKRLQKRLVSGCHVVCDISTLPANRTWFRKSVKKLWL